VLTLSGLLDDGAADRSAIEDAVAAVVTCKRRLVGPRVQDLRDATHHGRTLLRQLTALPVQDVPRGADLVARVRQTWTAWQAAERHYLTWASRIDDGGRCTQWSGEKLMGDREAKRAQRAEAGLVRFWNASVAPAYGLPPRSTPGG